MRKTSSLAAVAAAVAILFIASPSFAGHRHRKHDRSCNSYPYGHFYNPGAGWWGGHGWNGWRFGWNAPRHGRGSHHHGKHHNRHRDHRGFGDRHHGGRHGW